MKFLPDFFLFHFWSFSSFSQSFFSFSLFFSFFTLLPYSSSFSLFLPLLHSFFLYSSICLFSSSFCLIPFTNDVSHSKYVKFLCFRTTFLSRNCFKRSFQLFSKHIDWNSRRNWAFSYLVSSIKRLLMWTSIKMSKLIVCIEENLHIALFVWINIQLWLFDNTRSFLQYTDACGNPQSI